MTEASLAGNDFLATVCLDWEKAAQAAAAHGTRVVLLRTGIVLATLVNKRLQPGAQTLPWNGRLWTGSLAFTGAYQVHVVATNSIGSVSLVAPFIARR